MNIAEAFKLRNKLKARLESLQSGIDHVSYSVELKTLEKDLSETTWPALDYKTYDAVLNEIDTTRDALTQLNLAIETANDVNRQALNELHSLSSSIAWADKMLNKQRCFNETVESYDHVSEKYVVKLYKRATERDYNETLVQLKQRKDELEALIAVNNGKTQVSFVLPHDVSVY
jgi:DNA repair exonuclease SbcCD ATPase subunit